MFVDGAREVAGDADVEGSAAGPPVAHEPPPWASTIELGVALQKNAPHPRVVALEQVDRAGGVVAAASARDAIAAVGIGHPLDRGKGGATHVRDGSEPTRAGNCRREAR
jgi:hypothetical protein